MRAIVICSITAWLLLSSCTASTPAGGVASSPAPESPVARQPTAAASAADAPSAAGSPAETAAEATVTEQATERSAGPQAPPSLEATGPAGPAAEPPQPQPETPEPARSPTQIVTAPSSAFFLDYANSGARSKAVAECEKKNDEPEMRRACLEKEREKFQPDVLLFRRRPSGALELVIYQRLGDTLKEIYLGRVELSDEGSSELRIAFKGGSKGQRPLFRGLGKVTVKVPNDYSISIDDPEYGTLTYTAKVGFLKN